MSAAIDDMIGEAVASISFALRAAVMAVGRRQSISTERRRVRRPKPAGCVEPITKDSLDPIHDGDSIPGCVHNPNEPARRPGPAAADAACGSGRDRASTADHRGTAAQSLRPALGEARRSGGAARDRGSGAVGGGAGCATGSGGVAGDLATAERLGTRAAYRAG